MESKNGFFTQLTCIEKGNSLNGGWLIELFLKSLKYSWVEKECRSNFWRFIMFKECARGVGTPNFGEMKGRVFDFGHKMVK